MKVKLSKENIYDTYIPGIGHVDFRGGKFGPVNEEDFDSRCTVEIDDKLIDDFMNKSKRYKQLMIELGKSTNNIQRSILREFDKQSADEWGGDYSTLGLTLEKDDPLMSYMDLMQEAMGLTYRKNVTDELEKLVPIETMKKIWVHIAYAKKGAEKEKSIAVLKQFVADHKDKNPNLEEIIFKKVLDI
ncbi:MAG: hypothetical protein V1839_02560 [archaeon]